MPTGFLLINALIPILGAPLSFPLTIFSSPCFAEKLVRVKFGIAFQFLCPARRISMASDIPVKRFGMVGMVKYNICFTELRFLAASRFANFPRVRH